MRALMEHSWTLVERKWTHMRCKWSPSGCFLVGKMATSDVEA